MAKRKETLEIEQALAIHCQEKRIYGCEEVTIGFYNQGHGNEVVDYITMDSKGIIRCYEIKVTLPDLKSSAKKSWWGHYNYLVVTDELYQKVDDWSQYIPNWVGLIICHKSKHIVFQGVNFYSTGMELIQRPRNKNPDEETCRMLMMSMIRSMYYKKEKYKDANNLEKQKELQKELREYKQKYDEAEKERQRLHFLIRNFEHARRWLTGNVTHFEDIVEGMRKQALKIRSKNHEKRT